MPRKARSSERFCDGMQILYGSLEDSDNKTHHVDDPTEDLGQINCQEIITEDMNIQENEEQTNKTADDEAETFKVKFEEKQQMRLVLENETLRNELFKLKKQLQESIIIKEDEPTSEKTVSTKNQQTVKCQATPDIVCDCCGLGKLADYFCETCKEETYFCKHCDELFHSRFDRTGHLRKALNAVNVDVGISCAHCHVISHAECKDCSKLFCKECDAKYHDYPVLENHKRYELHRICDTCEELAFFHCDECNEWYCVDCDQSRHKKSKANHLRKEVHKNDVQDDVNLECLKIQMKELLEENSDANVQLNTCRQLLQKEEQKVEHINQELKDKDIEILQLRRMVQLTTIVEEERDVLKAQLEVYRTDFKRERKAREKAMGKNDELQSQLQRLQRDEQNKIIIPEPMEKIDELSQSLSSMQSLKLPIRHWTLKPRHSFSKQQRPPLTPEQYECPLCNRIFSSLGDVQLHVEDCADET